MSEPHHRNVGRPPPSNSSRKHWLQRISSHDGLSQETLRCVVTALLETDQPALTQCDLAAATGCSATTIRRATRALDADGVVKTVEWGGTQTVYLNHPETDWPMPPDLQETHREPAPWVTRRSIALVVVSMWAQAALFATAVGGGLSVMMLVTLGLTGVVGLGALGVDGVG